MNNFALFVFGLVISLISGFGVLIYITSLSYKKIFNEITDSKLRITPSIVSNSEKKSLV